MSFSTAVLLGLSLVILAGSLASFWLWSWMASGAPGRTLAWVSLSIGTLMLLVTAAVMILSITYSREMQALIAGLPDFSNVFTGSAGSNARSGEASPESQPHMEIQPSGESLRARRALRLRAAEGDSTEVSARAQDPHADESGTHDTPMRTDVSASGAASSSVDPWLASQCVSALRLEWNGRVRWTLENDCELPVAIVVATCSADQSECYAGTSRSWRYFGEGMLLPAKYQRPVTQDEQTVYGDIVRYAACYVGNQTAIRLIGLDSDARSSATWAQDFAAADEECWMQVRNSSLAGANSGAWVDLPHTRTPQP